MPCLLRTKMLVRASGPAAARVHASQTHIFSDCRFKINNYQHLVPSLVDYARFTPLRWFRCRQEIQFWAVAPRTVGWAIPPGPGTVGDWIWTNLRQFRPGCEPAGPNGECRSTLAKGRWISLAMSSAPTPSIVHPSRQSPRARRRRRRKVRMPVRRHAGNPTRALPRITG